MLMSFAFSTTKCYALLKVYISYGSFYAAFPIFGELLLFFTLVSRGL